MIFTAMSPLMWLVGALLLAAGLFLLQRLRARYRSLPVANLLLWQQAVQSDQVRSLWQRFRHWLAYLLILLIALLLWLLVAAPQWLVSTPQPLTIYYLDASAYMTAGDRFAAAKQQLLQDVQRQSSNARRVVLGDLASSLLLREGEQSALLAARLQTAQAQLQPSRAAAWLAQLKQLKQLQQPQQPQQRPIRVLYYGYPEATVVNWPNDKALSVSIAHASPTFTSNRGITSFGQQLSASGDEVEVYVEVAASSNMTTTPILQWFIDGQAYQPQHLVELPSLQASTWRYQLSLARNVGRQLQLHLAVNDDFAGDDQASLMLADSQPLKVFVSEQVASLFARVVAAEPSLQRVTDIAQAQVAVRTSADAASNLPSWIVAQPTTPAELRIDSAAAGTLPFAENNALTAILGFSEKTIAQQLQQPLRVSYEAASTSNSTRQLLSTLALGQSASASIDSATVPLMISRGLHWLANRQPLSYTKIAEQPSLPLAAAGPLRLSAFFISADGQSWQQRPVTPALLERPLTTLTEGSATLPRAVASNDHEHAQSALSLAHYLLLLVLALLGLEWIAVQRRWIP